MRRTENWGMARTTLIFFLLFSHACISAKRQMFNKMVQRSFQRFQVIAPLLLLMRTGDMYVSGSRGMCSFL